MNLRHWEWHSRFHTVCNKGTSRVLWEKCAEASYNWLLWGGGDPVIGSFSVSIVCRCRYVYLSEKQCEKWFSQYFCQLGYIHSLFIATNLIHTQCLFTVAFWCCSKTTKICLQFFSWCFLTLLSVCYQWSDQNNWCMSVHVNTPVLPRPSWEQVHCLSTMILLGDILPTQPLITDSLLWTPLFIFSTKLIWRYLTHRGSLLSLIAFLLESRCYGESHCSLSYPHSLLSLIAFSLNSIVHFQHNLHANNLHSDACVHARGTRLLYRDNSICKGHGNTCSGISEARWYALFSWASHHNIMIL